MADVYPQTIAPESFCLSLAGDEHVAEGALDDRNAILYSLLLLSPDYPVLIQQ